MPNIPSIWTIQGGAFALPTLLSEALIEEVQFAFSNRDMDTASFNLPMPVADLPSPFPFGSNVSIRQDGVQVFFGTVQEDPEVVLVGKNEMQKITVLSPWWYLENVTFQQAWALKNESGGTGTQTRSELILCQSLTGQRITTGQQIQEILAYAIGAGATFQVGSILDGVTAPTREALDITCAEALRQMLYWTPDASAWFDYATTPPTLHIRRRGELPAVTLPMCDDVAESLNIRARHDLQVPSVTLKFKQEHTFDESSWSTTAVDSWPVGANQQRPKAVVQTLELSGSHTTLQKQAITTRGLPAVGLDATQSGVYLEFFRARNPWLKTLPSDVSASAGIALNIADLAWKSGSFSVKMDPQEQFASDGKTPLDPDWTTAQLPRELVSGTVAPWMEAMNRSLKTGQLTLAGAVRFTGRLSDYTGAARSALMRIFRLDDSGQPAGEGGGEAELAQTVMATNALTQVYTQVTSSTAGEEVPTGLARELFIALNTLHHDGSFTTAEVEISRAVGLGNTLNLSGGNRTAWAAMNAQVQQISWAIASGKTTVKFGPPEHLSPQDMVAFLQGIRNSPPSYALDERVTGKKAANAVTDGAGKTPTSVNKNPPGGGGGGAEPHPFRVMDATGATDTSASVKFFSGSYVWKDLTTLLPITGLGNTFSVAAGQFAYLKLTIQGPSNVVPTACELVVGGAWEGSPDPNKITNKGSTMDIPYQSFFYQIVAEFVAENDAREGVVIGPKNNRIKVIQRLRDNKLCFVRDVNGVACLALASEELVPTS